MYQLSVDEGNRRREGGRLYEAVYTRENKPWIIQSVAYVSRELLV